MQEVHEIALRLLAQDYSPVRLEPGNKFPKHTGWQVEVHTEDSVLRQFARPSNIGVRCGDMRDDGTCLIALDIDVDDAELIRCVEKAIGNATSVKAGKKGATYILRFDGPLKTSKITRTRDGKTVNAIDVLAQSAQTVLPPSIHPETKLPYRWIAGMPLWERSYYSLPRIGQSCLDEIRGFGKRVDDPVFALNDMQWCGVGGGGNTHETCVAAVASMVKRGWPDEDIHDRVTRAKREACENAGEPYNWDTAQKIIQGWIDTARAKYGGPDRDKPKRFSHGALADAFLKEVKPNILYDWSRQSWYAFIETHWLPDQGPTVRYMVERFLPEASRNRALIEGICQSLRDRPELIVEKGGWDRAPFLLNTPSGTYDLRTKELRPARPEDRISRCTAVDPSFDYEGSFWIEKLHEWHGSDPEDIDYHQRLAGYFCTGETREECLSMWKGPGGDGKSKHAQSYSSALGTYAGVATDTAFLETRQGQHSEELAMLEGLRLVSLNEMSGRWREDRIKQVTGGESVTASFKHAHNFTYKPQFKLLVTANNPPRLRSVGRDMSRRFHVQNFRFPVKNPDRQLTAKLEAVATMTLGWMIDGAVKYYRDGLARSPSVERDTAEYFLDNDCAEQWIEHCAELGEGFRMLQTTAYESFRAFMEGQGYPPHRIPLRSTFQKALEPKGIIVKNAVIERGKSPEPALVGIRLKLDFNEKF